MSFNKTCLLFLFAILGYALGQKEVPKGCLSAPSQLRLAIGGENSMTISWTARINPYCIPNYRPVVIYSHMDVTAKSTKIGRDCIVKSNFEGEYYYTCNMPDLKYDSLYRYSVGDVTNGLSAHYTFRTAPTPGTTTKVTIIGDLGVDEVDGTITSLMKSVDTHYSDLIMHVGDISYADNERILGPNVHYDDIYNEFFDLIAPITSRAPYLVSPGNHDVSCHILGDEGCYDYHRNFTVYNTRFHMPSKASQSEALNMWYSINYGDIHIVSINTESDFEGAPYKPEAGSGDIVAGGFGDQMKWLEADLAEANKPENLAIRPWIVVVGHRPLYSSSTTDYPKDQESRTRKVLGPILQKYNVPLYISGHVHLYERTLPMKDGQVTKKNYGEITPGEVVYVINGAAGNEEGHPQHITEELPEYTNYRNNELFGIGMLTSHKSDPAYGPEKSRPKVNVGDVKLVGVHPPNRNQMGPNYDSNVAFTKTVKQELQVLEKSLRMKAGDSFGNDDSIYLCYAFTPAGQSPDEEPLDRFCLSKKK